MREIISNRSESTSLPVPNRKWLSTQIKLISCSYLKLAESVFGALNVLHLTESLLFFEMFSYLSLGSIFWMTSIFFCFVFLVQVCIILISHCTCTDLNQHVHCKISSVGVSSFTQRKNNNNKSFQSVNTISVGNEDWQAWSCLPVIAKGTKILMCAWER